MIELFESKQECCGCRACETICPKSAISMRTDEYGFQYPQVNDSLCIECGLCKKVCGYQHNAEGNMPMSNYAATYNDELTANSASGGIFIAIAKEFIKQGGVICGAVMDIENNRANCHHILATSMEDVVRMQGSKYVQSNTYYAYKEIKQILKRGKKVLFCGTPCQVASVKRIVHNAENLFTIDIICHGVPSIEIFNDFLDCQVKNNYSLVDFIFRDKTKGKGFNAATVVKKRGKVKKILRPSYLISYYRYFLESVLYRESCYSCPFATCKRIGDITIGDYWGIQEAFSNTEEQLDYSKTWSCIMVNTNKGNELLKQYGTKIEYHKSKFNNIARANEQLKQPSKKPQERNNILTIYSQHGYKEVEKYFRRSIGPKYYGLIIRFLLFGK